jgi:proteasome lid subunit RPN8/RPN11
VNFTEKKPNPSLGRFNTSRKNFDATRPFIFNGEIPFEPGVWHKIQDRVELWSKSDNPMEWACVLIGQPKVEKNEAIVPIVDFIELPIWQLSRTHGLSFLIDDVLRIAEKKFVAGLLHSHPNGVLNPSSADWATFTYLEAMLRRPLLYIIMGPSKDRKPLIIHFEACHKCPNSFLKIFKKIKEKGGEEHGTHQGMV